MKLSRIAGFAVVALGLAACREDEGPVTPPATPLAFVRYAHAVPDTGVVDFRMYDQLENSLNVVDAGYRSVSPYQGVATAIGARKIRVFARGTSTDINQVQQTLVDTALTFEANKYYTIVHAGFARAGATPRQRLVVIEDARPTVGANQVAVRVVNAAPGAASVDVYGTATATTPLPATPLAANVTYGNDSGYRTLATGPLVLRVFPAGATTGAMATATAPAGSAASGASTAIAGSTIAGSALTAFVFPAGVGNNASATASSIVFAQDNRP